MGSELNLAPYQAEFERLFAESGVELAYLFGSQATGKTWAGSDVDFAVADADFYIKTMREYQDTEPLRQVQDQAFFQRLKEANPINQPSNFKW